MKILLVKEKKGYFRDLLSFPSRCWIWTHLLLTCFCHLPAVGSRRVNRMMNMKLVSSFLWLVRKILLPSHRLSFWASGNKRNWYLTQYRTNREAGRELLVIIRIFHIQTLYFQQRYQGHLDKMLGAESLLRTRKLLFVQLFLF